MPQPLIVLDVLAKAIFEANADKGFWEPPFNAVRYFSSERTQDLSVFVISQAQYGLMKKAEKIALIHSELSECLEGIRKPGPSEHIPEFTKEEEEMADAIIRIFDYSGGFHLRLAAAVEAKLAFNAGRPYKHDKAF